MGWAARIAEAAYRGLEQAYNEMPLVQGTIDAFTCLCVGVGNLTCRLRADPTPARELLRKTLYAVINRATIIAGLKIMCIVAPYTLKEHAAVAEAVQTGLSTFIYVQQALFILELSVIGMGVQRDIGKRLRRPCENTQDPLKQVVVRLVAPFVVSCAGAVLPFPSLFRGISIGCQVHDTALSTRGFCSVHRTRKWHYDGLAYICIGIAVDSITRMYIMDELADATVYFLTIIACAVATCQPLKKIEGSTFTCRPLAMPYMFSYQIVERLRRAFVGGVFAPNLGRRTPLATTMLRVYRVFLNPITQMIIPLHIARPELHYLFAEYVTAEHLQTALAAVHDVIAASQSRIKTGTTLYLPNVASAATGLPKPVIALLQQIIADEKNVQTLHTIKEHLAVRLSDVKEETPLTFDQWAELGVSNEMVNRLALNAQLCESVWLTVAETPWNESLCLVDTRSEGESEPEASGVWVDVLSSTI